MRTYLMPFSATHKSRIDGRFSTSHFADADSISSIFCNTRLYATAFAIARIRVLSLRLTWLDACASSCISLASHFRNSLNCVVSLIMYPRFLRTLGMVCNSGQNMIRSLPLALHRCLGIADNRCLRRTPLVARIARTPNRTQNNGMHRSPHSSLLTW